MINVLSDFTYDPQHAFVGGLVEMKVLMFLTKESEALTDLCQIELCDFDLVGVV